MKKIALFLSLILLLTSALALIPSAASADNYYHGYRSTMQYWNAEVDGNDRYNLYRLPGIVVTKQDTVIIYGEARTTIEGDGYVSGDEYLFDLYLRRSTDGGKTFGDPIYIAKGQEFFENGYGETMNNPAMVCDENGDLHIIFSCNVGREGIWYSKSTDDGLTWSAPRDLSDMLGFGKNYRHIACGPGHGICLENGRLLFTVWVDIGTYSVHTIYSDDNGATWNFGGKVSGNKDESCAVELSDGSVMVNSRQYTFASEESPYRRYSISKTGINGWSVTKADQGLIDPACAASMCAVDIEGLPYAVLFVNCASMTSRNNVTVKCSFNDGLTWEKEIVLDYTNGGYSDIAVDSKGKVYVVYEANQGNTIQLVSFSFYDTFCKDDETKLNDVTTITEGLATMVTEIKNATLSTDSGESLTVKTKANQESRFVLDIAQKTAYRDLSETPFVKLKVKCDAGGGDITLGLSARCGRVDSSDKKLYTTATLKGDGEYHEVVFDWSENEYCKGTLQSVEIVLPQLSALNYDIAEIAFLSSYTPPVVSEPTTEQPTTDVQDNNPNSGCSSTVGMGALFCLLPVAVVVLKKKVSD